jgi:hypothetical protein
MDPVESDAGATGDAGRDGATQADAAPPVHTMAPGWLTEAPVGADGMPLQFSEFTAVDLPTGCSIALAQLGPITIPIVLNLYFRKRATHDGSCGEPLGYRRIGTSYADMENVFFTTDGESVAVAFTAKGSPATPALISLLQLDTYDLSTIHAGIDEVAGSTPPPVLAASMPEAIWFEGKDVVIEGSGPFVGATGTGPYFRARYTNFLVNTLTPASPAASAERITTL